MNETKLNHDDNNDIDIQQMRDIKLCNENYTIIINFILISIIIFFLWYILRKNYMDDEQNNVAASRNQITSLYPYT
jgi:large-conductance mechanosensitive channel